MAPRKTTCTNRTELKDLMASEKYMIIKISATWCGPCKRISPFFNQQLETFSDRLLLVEVDADEGSNICSYLRVKSVPTYINVIKGEMKDVCTSSSQEEVAKFFQKTMKKM